jgi:peptide/nickel transport system permease protein
MKHVITSIKDAVRRRLGLEGGGTTGIFIERLTRVVRRDKKAQFGLVVVLGVVGMAVFAPELAPYDPLAQDFAIMDPPSLAHPVGTDTLGRDVLSRLMHGARLSLTIAILAVTFGALTGCPLGIIAGYFGGRVDDAIMRFVDVIWAFPYLLLAILLVAIFGPGFWNVVIAIGIADLDDFARIVRGEVLSIREEEYILAAKSVGLGDFRILGSEVLPNVMTPIIVEFTILTARAMLSEATLSFLGLGVEPGTPTWGVILGNGRAVVTSVWWLSLSAGIAITITVLGINMFGDALRDAFDVEESGGGA